MWKAPDRPSERSAIVGSVVWDAFLAEFKKDALGLLRFLQRWHLAPRFPERPVRPEHNEPLRETSKQVTEKVVDDYYPQMAGRADSVRSRAQGGYTIAAAIAAAIITAGALSNIEERSVWTQLAAGAALVLWLLTVVLYAQAVAGHVIQPEAETAGSLAEEALYEVLFERAVLEQRLDWALYTTILAVVATILAVLSAFVLPVSAASPREPGELSLTPAGSAALRVSCGGQPSTLEGRFDAEELDGTFVAVEIDAEDSVCPNAAGQTLQLRSRSVVAAHQSEPTDAD